MEAINYDTSNMYDEILAEQKKPYKISSTTIGIIVGISIIVFLALFRKKTNKKED